MTNESDTTVMRRDELLPLVEAITPTPSGNVIPRALLERRVKLGSSEMAEAAIDIRPASSLIVLLLGLFIGLFVAIVVSA